MPKVRRYRDDAQKYSVLSMPSNNHMHPGSKKCRSFVALFFAAGDVKRYVQIERIG
jgi:hypothetical protein